MPNAEDIIAQAIEKADKSYFFEDYNKQARAVLAAFQKEGMRLVPTKPTEAMEAAGKDVIQRGRIRPSDFVRMIYEAMVVAGKI